MYTTQSASGQSVLDFIAEKNMQTQTQTESIANRLNRKLSMQMRAVLLIFNADPYLMEAVSPYVNLETETIFWDKIQKLPFGSGHKNAIRWAFGIWTDEMPNGNCFEGALGMSSFLQIAVLEALCLRWGLRG